MNLAGAFLHLAALTRRRAFSAATAMRDQGVACPELAIGLHRCKRMVRCRQDQQERGSQEDRAHLNIP
jgi:hypothetical protein